MTAVTQVVDHQKEDVRKAVDAILHDFFDVQESQAQTAELKIFTDVLREIIAAGGKRIRPVLCVTGWQAISETPVPPVVYRLAASLELFHAFALIHDDIMDNSATRRGRPAAHRVLSALHPGHHDRETLGRNAGILLGDLALGWSYDLLRHPETEGWALPWDLLNTMRTETLTGQYLDLSCARQAGQPDIEASWQVIRYKTARYTFERPLQLGALLAGATRAQQQALAAYAAPVGEAFQLRDDLLGVFGNPDETGKPTLDDLREGKRTVLVATAWSAASDADRASLARLLGDPELGDAQAEEVREILIATGAVDTVESLIEQRRHAALAALAALDGASLMRGAADRLRQIAAAATSRTA